MVMRGSFSLDGSLRYGKWTLLISVKISEIRLFMEWLTICTPSMISSSDFGSAVYEKFSSLIDSSSWSVPSS